MYFFHLLALDNFSSLVSETIILKILLSDDYLTSSNNRKKGAYNFSMPSFRVFFFFMLSSRSFFMLMNEGIMKGCGGARVTSKSSKKNGEEKEDSLKEV